MRGDNQRFDFGLHDFTNRGVGIGNQNLRNGDLPNEFITTIHDPKVVGHRREFTIPSDISKNDVDGDVRTHGHDVGIHQAAGGIFVIGQHIFDALPVLRIH